MAFNNFKENFMKREDIPKEYLEGDGLQMLNIMFSLLNESCFKKEVSKEEAFLFNKEEEDLNAFLDKTYEIESKEFYNKLPQKEKHKYVQNIRNAYILYNSNINKKVFSKIVYKKVDFIRTNKIRVGFIGKLK